jgi:DHA2 family multidrug resistance protein-like MFS transporter
MIFRWLPGLTRLRFVHSDIYPAGAGVPPHMRIQAMVSLMLGVCLSSIDAAIANTALPTMARELHTSEARSVWIVSAYQLTVAAGMLPLARLGEVVGHRRLVIGGQWLFLTASLMCGFAPSLPWLVAARVLQGVGGAATISVNGAMLRFIFPAHRMGRGVGINALVVGVSFAAGPTLASMILSLGSWSWLFWINVPISALAIVLGLATLPNTARSAEPFDVRAALLCAAFFALLIFTLNEAAHGRAWPVLALEATLTAAALLGLLRRQAGAAAPLLPLDLLRRPLFALSSATSICSFVTQALVFVSLPFLLQKVMGFSQIQTGYLITPWPACTALMAPIAGRLSDRYPAGLLGGIGLVMLAAGVLSLALLPAQPAALDIVWRMGLCGAGFGFFQSPNLRTLVMSAPPERSGSASGMVGASRTLGQSMGAAMVAACLHMSVTHGPWLALWLGAGFAALASAASISRLRYR